MVDINNKHPASIHYKNIHTFMYSNYDPVLSYPHPASILIYDLNSDTDYYRIYQHNKLSYNKLKITL